MAFLFSYIKKQRKDNSTNMEKKITSNLIKEVRPKLNEAVKGVAAEYGLAFRFGDARFDDNTATFKVEMTFAATDGYDPAKAKWDSCCKLYGFEPEDFGKEFSFVGEDGVFRISGINTKAQKNTILIQRIPDGKEYMTSPLAVRTALGKLQTTQVPAPATNATPGPSAPSADPRKMEWDLNCWRWDFKAEDFGKEILLRGTRYAICGCKPNARKNSILIRNIETGTEYVINPDGVKNNLIKK